MTPRERFLAAANCEKVDALPVTTWVHFLSDHLTGEETAQLHERFQNAYQWDLLKVMGDYRYPVPAGLETLESPKQLLQFEPVALDAPCFKEQLKCLTQLRKKLGADFPLIDTGFDPYQSIVRNIGRDQQAAMWEFKDATLKALETVCDSICAYIQELKKLGIEGYFYSMNSAIPDGFPRGVSQEVYETFLRPFDLRVLESAEGMVRILHVHGTGLDLTRLKDYPFEVINLSDRAPDNPSVKELRDWTDKCVMGGLEENTLPDLSLGELKRQIDDALEQAGGREGFILAPGCTIPSYAPKRSLDFLRSYTRAL